MVRVLILSKMVKGGTRVCPDCGTNWQVQFGGPSPKVFKKASDAREDEYQNADSCILDVLGNNLAVKCCGPED